MRKKILATSFLVMSLASSLTLTSYAGWVQDNYGWAYEKANGVRLGGGWFTDPETELIYYLDPGGYMMSNTMVEGYRLAEDGHRLDKTERQLELEAKRTKEKTSRPTPNKVRLQIENAGKEAVARGYSIWTLRSHYQSEMQAFMDKIFKAVADEIYKDRKERREQAYEAAREAARQAALENEGVSNVGDMSVDLTNLYPTSTFASKNNEEVRYNFHRIEDGQEILMTYYSKITKKDPRRYVPYAFELSYNRGLISSETDLEAFDDGYQKMLAAALGQYEGESVFQQVMEGSIEDGITGTTDSGNTYEVFCKDGAVKIQVTCSEKMPEDESEEQNDDNSEENASSETQETTSKVITAGQGEQADESTEAQQSDGNQENSETSENQGEGSNQEASENQGEGSNQEASENQENGSNQ